MPQKANKTKALKPASLRNAYFGSHLESWKRALKQGLEDDGGFDWTTLGTVTRPRQILRARVIAKSHGIWAGHGLIAAMREVETRLEVTSRVSDGERLGPGQLVCEWSGPADRVLALERPFLNLASYVGGIAFRTAELVEIVHQAFKNQGTPPRVTATRKTLPGYRDLAICGILAGGGHSHRVSLSGGVLIKENHIAAAGSIEKAIYGVRRVAPHGLKVEIEVRNQKELKQALAQDIDAVLLDNFSPDEVRAALGVIAKTTGSLGAHQRPVVEVSGGLSERNIANYAIPGVHVLSVGSLTHSVTATDFSLLVLGT
jgi:nicotinate-nucleotide pyrophosphorylase (carboxylating)